MSDTPRRNEIQVGKIVQIVQKQDQRTGNLTEGTVKRILTSSNVHPHGIKVELDNGKIGRVQNILSKNWIGNHKLTVQTDKRIFTQSHIHSQSKNNGSKRCQRNQNKNFSFKTHEQTKINGYKIVTLIPQLLWMCQ